MSKELPLKAGVNETFCALVLKRYSHRSDSIGKEYSHRPPPYKY
jgi:hypothetical protein